MNTKKIIVKVTVIGDIRVRFYGENFSVMADSRFPTLINFSNVGIGSAYLPVKTAIQDRINTRLETLQSPLSCYWDWDTDSYDALVFGPKANATPDKLLDNRELVRDVVLSLLDDLTLTEQENFGYVGVDLSLILNEVQVCE